MRTTIALLGAALLCGCSAQKAPEGRQDAKLAAFDIEPAPMVAANAPPGEEPAPPPGPGTAPIAVSIPQMAYTYSYGFRLPGDAIRRAQSAHVAICDRLGAARCQILALSSGDGEGAASEASLKMRVAAGLARDVGRRLQAAVSGVGGRTVSDSIAAEDVSKEIVDTEARLKQRTLLVERLTDILRQRTGKVSELVEAERSVAAAQEEIDQARGWLAELRGRVAMSTIDVSYNAVAADPAPRSAFGDAIARSLSGFTSGVAALLVIVIMLAPWALLAGLGWLAWRRFGRPWLARRRSQAEEDQA